MGIKNALAIQSTSSNERQNIFSLELPRTVRHRSADFERALSYIHFKIVQIREPSPALVADFFSPQGNWAGGLLKDGLGSPGFRNGRQAGISTLFFFFPHKARVVNFPEGSRGAIAGEKGALPPGPWLTGRPAKRLPPTKRIQRAHSFRAGLSLSHCWYDVSPRRAVTSAPFPSFVFATNLLNGLASQFCSRAVFFAHL